jgi:hypothetical protein
MKLAAIYNVWDGVELLRGSMLCLRNKVDVFIIVYQTVSNFGEAYDPSPDMDFTGFDNIIGKLYTPEVGFGHKNEINKRNLGIILAREQGCTHFLHLDCDEYYFDFTQAKREYIIAQANGATGSVCKLFTYFKRPTLRFATEDGYYVPFIHQLHPDTSAGRCPYPFHVDPTRRINQTNIALLNTRMHHYSWVRNDIGRKCRNSSARRNIERGTILADYNNPSVGPGFYVRDFDKTLVEVASENSR